MANLTLLQPEILQQFSLLVPESETPLWQYWDEFVEKYLRTGKSEVTVSRVRDSILFAMRQLNIVTIEAMNIPRLVENALFAYKAKNHISNTTFNTYLKNFNTYFIWLYKHEYIALNNLHKIDRCKEDVNEQYMLNGDQVKMLVARVHDRQQTRLQRLRNVFFIDLLRFTGARPCELVNMQMRDITQNGNTYKLVIRGKKQKGRPRYYFMPSWLRDSYESYVQYRSTLRQNETNLLISSSSQGGWTQKGMRGFLRLLSEEVGFRVISYGFRRYVATKLNAEGLTLKEIGDYLGQSRESTTRRYVERDCVLTNKGAGVMGE